MAFYVECRDYRGTLPLNRSSKGSCSYEVAVCVLFGPSLLKPSPLKMVLQNIRTTFSKSQWNTYIADAEGLPCEPVDQAEPERQHEQECIPYAMQHP